MRARATAMAATAATTSFHLGFRANLGLRRLKTSTSSAEVASANETVYDSHPADMGLGWGWAE